MSFHRGYRFKQRPFKIENSGLEGGFGITYKAIHETLGFPAIVKVPNIRKRYQDDYDKSVAAFIREGRFLGELQNTNPHPNIVKVFDFFEEEITEDNQKILVPCLVMDFVQGEDLIRLVKRTGKLSEDKAVHYIKQVGEALTVCHDAGVIHRDCHPGNILLRSNSDTVVLIDFGLAGNIGTEYIKEAANQAFAPWEQVLPQSAWTQTLTPEDLRKYNKLGIKDVKKASTIDTYTLAASLYYLVTGETPTNSLSRKLFKQQLIPPINYNRNISSQLNQAILAGLELEPSNRPQSVQEWLKYLAVSKSAADVPLISAVGMDYTTLRDLLAVGKWREADEETARVILKVAGREEQGWLNEESINKFPCEDLCTIDQLWVKYSKGRFGFSVQKRIWIECGGQPGKYDYEVYKNFGDRIGWGVKDEWKSYYELNFSLNAPQGHLPGLNYVGISGLGFRAAWWAFGVILFPRVETCKL
ncbi:MAG: serine/threonine-protein kinase [Crinalium sp.]